MNARRPDTAGDVYEHRLEDTQHGPLRRAAQVVGDIVTAALSGGPADLTSAGDVVVRRRSDRAEVLRVSGGPPEEAAALVEHVGQQLDTLSVEDFHLAWSIDGPGAPRP